MNSATSATPLLSSYASSSATSPVWLRGVGANPVWWRCVCAALALCVVALLAVLHGLRTSKPSVATELLVDSTSSLLMEQSEQAEAHAHAQARAQGGAHAQAASRSGSACPMLELALAEEQRKHSRHHSHQHSHIEAVSVSVSGAETSASASLSVSRAGGSLARSLNFSAVAADIRTALTNSQAFWPADHGNYGPLLIRQAWHCAGTYRKFDGRGGCDGGRQRFEPERSWLDNVNLDKSKILLEPIKQKYGKKLSWGDLIILAGNVAIESMGGTTMGFCGGRIDDWNGDDSLLLDPNANEQFPCAEDGNCKAPLGTTTKGLVYVNPEGPKGVPLPSDSAVEIREVFARMRFDDQETVALIGGGHTFGKAHGACPLGPGPSPAEDPLRPWPGRCGDGKGENTFTSGFEGSWTLTPTKFSNDFFKNLVKFQWTNATGPGGHQQWKIVNPPDERHAALMMLTSDVALVHDEAYKRIAQRFAEDEKYFADAFASAWYELTSRDMGPHSRCVGDLLPPPQSFQFPLPPPPQPLANFNAVRAAILDTFPRSELAIFVQLAFHCAATFRRTDYSGGCNGARIRLAPEREWPVNAGLGEALSALAPIKETFGTPLSWADLIVLAGTVALEDAAGGKATFEFCGGRSDALPTDLGSKNLVPWDDGAFSKSRWQLKEFQTLVGLSDVELVALSGRVRSAQGQKKLGFSGVYDEADRLSNRYYNLLLSGQWEESRSHAGKVEYVSVSLAEVNGQFNYLLVDDVQLKQQPEYLAVVEMFAEDEQLFLRNFVAAWTKLVNADRFDGPSDNLCAN